MKRLELKDGRLVEVPATDDASLVIANDLDLAREAPALEGVSSIALHFPALRDGRAFSQARALRRLGFEGDIRATGSLFRDQVLFAIRCGFTSFDFEDGVDTDGIMKSVARYPAYYQGAVTGRPVWERRA